jgi:hypothetical protein
MKIFKKKEQIPVNESVEVEGAQVWMVTWNSLHDNGYSSPTLVCSIRRAKAFLSYEDAKEFRDSLERAMKLLQCTFKINIDIEKQE